MFSKFLVLSFMLAFCLCAAQFQVRAWVVQCSHWTESFRGIHRGIHYIHDADSACSCLCACVLIRDVSMNLINSWFTNVNLIRGSYLVLMESRSWINKDIKNNVTNKIYCYRRREAVLLQRKKDSDKYILRNCWGKYKQCCG